MDGTSHLRAVVPKHVHELTGLYRIEVVPVDAPTHLPSSGKSSNIVSEVVSSIVGSSSLWYRITTLARNPESKELHTHSADKNTDSGDVSIEKSDSIRDTGVPDAANQEIIDGNDNDTLSSPNSSSSQNAHLIEDEDAFGGGRDDFIESIAIKKNLTTYVVHRSLEHFVWFQRQFTEKEPFLLVGELPNSLTSAIEDPLGTTDQITAMLFFMATGALTASDPLLWSLLAVPDEDFYKQFEDLISSEKKR